MKRRPVIALVLIVVVGVAVVVLATWNPYTQSEPREIRVPGLHNLVVFSIDDNNVVYGAGYDTAKHLKYFRYSPTGDGSVITGPTNLGYPSVVLAGQTVVVGTGPGAVALKLPRSAKGAYLTVTSMSGDAYGATRFAPGVERATVWRHGIPTLLPLPIGLSKLSEVKARGNVIVGTFNFGYGYPRIVIWRNGRPTALPIPPTLLFENCLGVDKHGIVYVQRQDLFRHGEINAYNQSNVRLPVPGTRPTDDLSLVDSNGALYGVGNGGVTRVYQGRRTLLTASKYTGSAAAVNSNGVVVGYAQRAHGPTYYKLHSLLRLKESDDVMAVIWNPEKLK